MGPSFEQLQVGTLLGCQDKILKLSHFYLYKTTFELGKICRFFHVNFIAVEPGSTEFSMLTGCSHLNDMTRSVQQRIILRKLR